MSTEFSRRDVIKLGVVAAVGGTAAKLMGDEPAFPDNVRLACESAFAALDRHLTDLVGKMRLDYGSGLRVWASGNYSALWPDDFLYPLIVHPSFMKPEELTRLAALLADSIVDMDALPDRVEASGLPVMNPGAATGNPHGNRMPLHLPAAWTRLLDYFEALGATLERKGEWAAAIRRGFDLVPFSCGLTYVNPQRPSVGYGFHDMAAITGFELMSSLALYRGLQRAASLFDGVIGAEVVRRWNGLADKIKANLHRLYDDEQGAFRAGSVDCRQVNVWGNGLAYWLVDKQKQKRIADWYFQHRDQIFKCGYTCQIAEPNGWQRQLVECRVGTYINGGFWSTGTGYILPVLARHYPDLAVDLIRQLVENLPAHNFTEALSADGKGHSNLTFITGVAMPMVGLRSILERRPLIAYF